MRIGVGEIAIARGDVPYAVADDPATTPALVVTSADYCPGSNGAEPAARTCGTPAEGAAVLLSGAFERRGELSERLLRAPPMAYLADWRIALATDMLREPGQTVGTVPRKVGYSNAFALSVAFKRLRGTRPSDYRARSAGIA